MDEQRRRLRVRGVVQGVGFRPFVHGLATSLGLAGTVSNDTGGVVIEIEGPVASLEEFERRLHDEAPPLADIDAVERTVVERQGGLGFAVVPSRDTDGPAGSIPPDAATCDDCLRELFDPADRRHRHPFITCTNCGPRFTITTALPYDRPNTTMAGFPLCSACRAEYEDPADRRFHAQPLACHDCGPQLELVDHDGRVTHRRDAALRAAQELLAAGAIVAVQGIGGYHLVCDATAPGAVQALRTRKRRGEKPFAVMAADLSVVEDVVELDAIGRAALQSVQRPILLARRKGRPPDGSEEWPDLVAPGVADVGVMLPYAPVHHLLFDGPVSRVLVCTSGNLAEEPIVTDPDDAVVRLAGLADAWLQHDRPIHTSCDDSIVRVMRGRVVPIRRSRGWVPLPVDLDGLPPVLAMGGDLKGAVCVADGRHAWLSQHLGDLGELATFRAARRAVEQLLDLTRTRPEVVAVDAHPSYLSARLGREIARELGVPVVTVQHHHAHVASVLAEHGRVRTADGPVIGIAFDGTGFGEDGSIWGGEVLVADGRSAERVMHLADVPLPGGDAAIEHPARSALAHMWTAGCPWDARLAPVAANGPTELDVLRTQFDRSVSVVPTSSMGRLFDAIAAIVGVRQTVSYEAQAAIELEAIADRSAAGAYSFAEPDDHGAVDAAPVVRAVVEDVLDGVAAGTISMRFHRAVIALVVDAAERMRSTRGLSSVALTGGVFQNSLLLEGCGEVLGAAGFEVLLHERVPTNDGGLSLGQAVVAGRHRMSED